jgi:hypothetical protein
MAKLYVAEYPGLATSGSGDALVNIFAVPPTTEQVIDTTAGTGSIATLGAITAGAAYVNGTYRGVPLTGGTGNGAVADITVAGGAVTAVSFANSWDSIGQAYTVADTLSASNTNLGGAGAGFSVPVATITHDSLAFQTSTTFVEVSCDSIVSVAWGRNPVAATTNMRLAAGERKQVGVLAISNPINPQGALLTERVSAIVNT